VSTMHDEQTLAAAYALGALDLDDRRGFEAHLESCAACREEVRSLLRVADALAHSTPQRTPRPELRERVLADIAPAGRQTPVSKPETPARGPGLRAWLPLAAALVAAIGLGVYNRQLQGRIAVLEDRLDDAERRAALAEGATVEARRVADRAQTTMAVLSAPDLVRIDLAGQAPAQQASARALWSRNRGMVFTTTNLPAAPAGRVYQVWVVTAEAPVSAGLLTPDPTGRATVFFETPIDIAPPVAVAVTLEPAGGVPAPTGDRYLIGKPLG
jgi:anti-sigma-K factor RskA